MNEISQRARELLATVDMIETRPIEWPFSDEQTPPIWRIELDGYCADFEHSEAANNFALAINARIEKALSPLPSGDDLVERVARAICEPVMRQFDGWHPKEPVNWDKLPGGPRDQEKLREIAAAAIASIPGRDEVIEECAKVAESLHAWHGSADLINGLDRRRFAYAIRALKSQGGEKGE